MYQAISLSFILITGFFMSLPAQHAEVKTSRKLIYQGYVSGQLDVWQQGVDRLATYCESNPGDLMAQYEWALGEYGLIGGKMEKEESGLLESVKALQGRVDDLIEARPDWPEAHALMGGLYGMRVSLSPAATMIYGPRSVRYIDKAVELNSRSPAAWIEKGNAKYHAPAIFGGSVPKAITCYQKAVSLYESNPVAKQESWLYLYALAWLGIAYQSNDQLEEARNVFRKALRIEPDFSWVRDELMPQVAQKP